MAVIRNPLEWGRDQVNLFGHAVGSAGHAVAGDRDISRAPPQIRRITVSDLRDAIARGFGDFAAYRTDVIFLCLIYPIAGLVLARAASGLDLLPLIFPLASGFALIGPIAGLGLYEMSRRRERGDEISSLDAFGVLRSPSFGAIVAMSVLLVAIFFFWMVTANYIYDHTLGPDQPATISGFVRDVLTTQAGWTMGIVGVGVGFLYAVLVLAIGVISFPLLLDRDVGLGTAITTSVRAVWANPGVMAVWGMIVTASLVLGSIPLFVGLVIVMPVLGHATWHLYRKIVIR